MTLRERNRCRKIDCGEVCEMIRPGDRIFISSGAATPMKTISMIIASDHSNLFDLEILQLAVPNAGFIMAEEFPHKLRWKTFNVGEAIGHSIHQGQADFIPSNLAEIPYLFYSDALDVNVAIVQTSLPDSKGFLNLGMAADVADLVIKNAPISIAEMNPRVPITQGETSVHIDQFTACVESAFPLLDRGTIHFDDVSGRIGWHVANLIEDGSTVTLHCGTLFDAIAQHLHAKKNLRICSHTVSDWAIDLIKSGALAQDRGINHQGIITASYCLASSRFYDYVDRNPFFSIVPLIRASYQAALPKIQRLVSIIDAVRVDVTGSAIVVQPKDCFLPGFAGKLSFSMASTLSREGKSVVTVSVQRKVDR